MAKTSLGAVILVFCCLVLILTGCPKKTMVKEEPSVRQAQEEAAAAERARLEAERERARLEAERAMKEKELREREEAARKAAEAQKDFEKSLVAKKYPGIEGEVLESRMLKDIHFEFDRYDIRPQDAAVLKENAALLRKYPTYKVQIEGHCDERGPSEYNLALGERRANSTKKYLMSLGVAGTRISTISYGEERPLDPGHNEDAWAKNRRAHTVVLSK